MLAHRFDMFLPEQKKQFDSLLEDMFSQLHSEICAIGNMFNPDKETITFGDIDYSLTRIKPINDSNDFYDTTSNVFLLKDHSAGWWGYLEAGVNLRNLRLWRSFLRVYCSVGEAPKTLNWNELFTEALLGKAKICIDAKKFEDKDGWYDHIPIIDFGWPLRHNLKLAIKELTLPIAPLGDVSEPLFGPIEEELCVNCGHSISYHYQEDIFDFYYCAYPDHYCDCQNYQG